MDIDVRYTLEEKPKLVLEKAGRLTYMYLPFDIIEEDGKYTCKYVKVSRIEYGEMVDAIVSIKYSTSKNFAIINNYLSDPENTEYKSEYEDLQKWRVFAKGEAKKYFNL
jgi:hypothetical protein